jgi:RND family efflux transporter MFP subunit
MIYCTGWCDALLEGSMRSILILITALLLTQPSGVAAQLAVSVEDISTVLVDLERRAPADVKPLNSAQISAEVAAVVKTLHADVGQRVSAGELLVELEARDYELNLNQARANLASSQAQKASADAKLARAQDLVKDKYLSDDTLLDRQTDAAVWSAQIRANEVAVAIAQRSLDKCRVLAPFDGVVVERTAQIGSYIGNGSPLVRVTQVDRFELDAEIPSNVADSLLMSDEIRFVSRGQEWPLKLLRLSPVIESERRTQRARLAFSGEAPAIGRSGEVVWHVDKGMLPSNLISRRNGQLGVFLHDQGKAVFTPLPGAQEGRPVAVELPADAEIITLGRNRLQDGDSVSVSR